MEKQLQDMSSEELWQLFPIQLSPHSSLWKAYYRQEKARIVDCLGRQNVYRVHHCGSTSVPGLLAKPIVDILLEVPRGAPQEHIASALSRIGYLFQPPTDDTSPDLMMFLKGYTPQGFADRVFHLHVRYPGDWGELYFRDYLAENPATARAYEGLKQELARRYKHNRDEYTHQKTSFVQSVTQKARQRYGPRYAPE